MVYSHRLAVNWVQPCIICVFKYASFVDARFR